MHTPDLIRRFLHPPPVVAVLRLAGLISAGRVGRHGLALTGLAETIERAFSLRHLRAVALAINSPGGSPAQSSLLYGRIRALATEKNVPVVAFTEDVAASGGYWLALAADEIYADASSVIGSIGVISAGFGFPALLNRYGIERRVQATGPRKGMLDPFREENPDDVARLKDLHADIFSTFKTLVRDRRGERLKAADDVLFSGDIWVGQRAVDLGLVDGLGDVRSVMRARYGDDVHLRLVSPRGGWLRRRFGLAGGVPVDGLGGEDLIAQVFAAAEERATWARYGL